MGAIKMLMRNAESREAFHHYLCSCSVSNSLANSICYFNFTTFVTYFFSCFLLNNMKVDESIESMEKSSVYTWWAAARSKLVSFRGV